MALRFHLDEHVDPAVAIGLRRRGIDVTTTVEAGLRSATDDEHLNFAREQQRVLFTHDTDFLALAASDAVHAGIVYCSPGSRTLRQMIEHLALIAECLTADEMRGRVEFC